MAVTEQEIQQGTFAGRQLTEEELMALPDDGRKYELVDGRAKEVPTGFEHEDIGANIMIMMAEAGVRRHGRLVGSSAGFRMKSGNVRAPDVSFVRTERVPHGPEAKKYFSGAPDLAVEVISPSEDMRDAMDKVAEYFEAGAQQVWQVHPGTGRVVVFRSLDSVRTYEADEELDGGDLLPGFRCRVADLFETAA